MTTHYGKAPITEALIDIRVRANLDVTPEQLGEVRGELAAEAYPHRQPMFLASFNVDAAAGDDSSTPTTKTSHEQRGWAFFSADKRQVWQARSDGFTFSRLAPYDRWTAFSSEARRLWTLTRPTLQVESVVRIAVRYINRLELPLPFDDFKDYLRTVPEVSPALPQALSGFFLQVQIPQPDVHCLAIINQTMVPAMEPTSEPTSVSVILDIELATEHDLRADDDALWERFKQLHVRKNEVFEGCISDRMRELIK